MRAEVLTKGISTQMEEAPKTLSPIPPSEYTGKRQAFMNNGLSPDSRICQPLDVEFPSLQSCGKYMFIVLATQCVVVLL